MANRTDSLKAKMESFNKELDGIAAENLEALIDFKELLSELGKTRAERKIDSAIVIIEKLVDDRFNPPVVKKTRGTLDAALN